MPSTWRTGDFVAVGSPSLQPVAEVSPRAARTPSHGPQRQRGTENH
jgi:hypothetical protein